MADMETMLLKFKILQLSFKTHLNEVMDKIGVGGYEFHTNEILDALEKQNNHLDEMLTRENLNHRGNVNETLNTSNREDIIKFNNSIFEEQRVFDLDTLT